MFSYDPVQYKQQLGKITHLYIKRVNRYICISSKCIAVNYSLPTIVNERSLQSRRLGDDR